MREFRSGLSLMLITTDSLARGIDVRQVSVVVNYDLPADCENYAHRSGRCGRLGCKGVSISFVATREPGDVCTIQDIEAFYKIKIEEMPWNVADFL